jgi:hypothetical protein
MLRLAGVNAAVRSRSTSCAAVSVLGKDRGHCHPPSNPRHVFNCMIYLPHYCGCNTAVNEAICDHGQSILRTTRREPRTHSFRHQGALRRFQRDPAPRSGRPAIKKARDMFQSKRIDEFGAGRAALRKVLLEVASIRCTLGIVCRRRHARRQSLLRPIENVLILAPAHDLRAKSR